MTAIHYVMLILLLRSVGLQLFEVKPVLLQIIDTRNSRACPQPSVGSCVCTWTGTYLNVTCIGLDNMPKKLPGNTTYLTMIKGTIKHIPVNYLTSFKHLYFVDLQHNEISSKFFLPKSVMTLILNDNKLNASTLFGMFDGLTKLRTLDLGVNPLGRRLVSETFSDLKNLVYLDLSYCELEDIEEYKFSGLINLRVLSLTDNRIRTLKKGAIDGIRSQKQRPLTLSFGGNQISRIENGMFENVQSIFNIRFARNELSAIPDLTGLPSQMKFMDFESNNIADLSFLKHSGIHHVHLLGLGHNNISVLPADVFQNISIVTLDLSFNRIKQLPPRFLYYPQQKLIELALFNNQIELIDKESFVGLQEMRRLYLFNNNIQHLPDGVFSNLSLQYLLLNNNKFSNLKGRPFKGMKDTKTSICLFSNALHHIDDNYVKDLGNESKVIIECKALEDLPRVKMAKIVCAPHSWKGISGITRPLAVTLSRTGFTCKVVGKARWYCSLCKAGTFGNSDVLPSRCTNCSAGGFYQDGMGENKCNECNVGTYVHPNNTPAATPLSCQACPQGTKTSEQAGYRACKCLRDFYRFDRFGGCSPCLSNAFKCENDHASLSEGFYWKWVNTTDENKYNAFISNLMIESRKFAKGTWKYEGTLPSPHKCPRRSCLGGLNSSCQNGYHGPLCALCELDHYNRMNRCVQCPSKMWAGFQVAIVVVLFVFVLLAIVWGDRKSLQNESGRTIADKILSCFKIVMGFYQVMAGVYSAFSDINWPSSVIWMQKTLHFIQLNIMQIAPLRCITYRLSFNVLQQFAIVVSLNVIVSVLIIIYLVIRIAMLKRRNSSSPSQIDESVAKTKSSCIRNICVFLFATYPKTCTSIIQVLSINCLQLCFDEERVHCAVYLRSDLSVQCHTPEHNIYSRIATAFLVYPIGFPVVIMILVWKYIHKPSQKLAIQMTSVNEDAELPNMVGVVGENRVHSSAICFTSSPRESPFKSGLSLFSENYKSNCWYWEALEMVRKLVLISGLTLIGEHSRSQIGLGAIISAVFAILYVYKRPITNKFENMLQAVALMAIFLNLGIGVMLKTSDDQFSPVVNKKHDEVGVAVVLIMINVAVIGIVAAAVVKAVIMQMSRCCKCKTDRTCSCRQSCQSCLKCCLGLMFHWNRMRIDDPITSHSYEYHSALLHDAPIH